MLYSQVIFKVDEANRYTLTLMLLVAYLANTKSCRKPKEMTETPAYRYTSKSTQQELSNEYQHDRMLMVFQKSLSHRT